MPVFSARSMQNLRTCHPDLQRVFMEVIKHVDCSIICGYRNEADQNKAYDSGASKLRFPKSMHNRSPSLAVDCVRHPIDWENRENHLLFAGFVLGVAGVLGVKLRYGGDWNRDFRREDETYNDLVHFELVPAALS